ncbi:CAP domain-containing protein [Mycolicibacterium sp. A43C]
MKTAIAATTVALAVAGSAHPPAHADNTRLNSSVVQMVSIVQYKAGCRAKLRVDARLQQAAQQHALDVRDNRALAGHIGSDGSTVQQRAAAAGYPGSTQETVAINPALAISSMELINMWYWDPEGFAVMSNCAQTDIGVWSENSLDRTVVVAVYGSPSR